MVAENTSTAILDHLIMLQPHRLEFYRTRGIVKMFLDQFQSAAKDFTHALLESRAERKRRTPGRNGKKKGKGKGKAKAGGASSAGGGGGGASNGHAATVEEDCTDVALHRPVAAPFPVPSPDDRPQHPSARPDAPLPMEPQCLFLRASSYFTHAVWLIEGAALAIEGVKRNGTNDGVEVRLCNIAGGRFGGVEVRSRPFSLPRRLLAPSLTASPSPFARAAAERPHPRTARSQGRREVPHLPGRIRPGQVEDGRAHARAQGHPRPRALRRPL